MTAATRVSRSAAVRRRRAAAVVAGVALVVAGADVVSRLGDAAGGGPTKPNDDVRSSAPSELLVLQVVGTDDPLLAVIGAADGGRRPSFFSVPFDLTLTVPGQGEARAAEVADLDADTVRVAVSNTFGAWAEHVAVVDLDGLAAMVDRGKGIRVQVPGFYVTEAGNLGPGAARLNGEQVVALLDLREEGGEARWASVLQALLRERVRLGEGDLAETDGIGGVEGSGRGGPRAPSPPFP
ncbi:MAG: LCP family protein, partial [Actinomycetota bacterium]